MATENIGNNILNFLQDNESFDEVAGQWSGFPYARNFNSEIEAHADLLLNRGIIKVFRLEKFNATDIKYFNSAGITDLGNRDRDIGKSNGYVFGR